MKKLILSIVLFSLCTFVYPQINENVATIPSGNAIEKKPLFDKSNLFTGGNINLSFFNGATVLGGTPHFGYSITKWLDAAVSFNYTYISQRYDFGDRARQNLFAPGVFLRAHPLEFLFVHAQYEHSFITQKYLFNGGGTSKTKYQVNSFLIGPGYSSGRENGSNTFYYFSVLFDVLQQPGSPYTDSYNRIIPFVSAGFNIGLFQGGGRRSRQSDTDGRSIEKD